MRLQSLTTLLVGGLAVASLPTKVEGKTCLMLYQMADNNLEYYLRQDYQELTESAVIRSSDLRTWVYYDALNQGGQALPNTIDSNGNPVTASFTGSRYLTYDPAAQKMRIDRELQGEQNSDTLTQVQSFLEHALNDCLANGYTSLFAIFSSHGGGFAGYGGDENDGTRKLLQTNAQIASAIQNALANSGGPTKLEVIGFDACLMQAVGSADDYKDVANYLLASEAVEPGHGWAYRFLTNAATALDLAREILVTFLTETQGGSSHQSPKTMAILDTAKFSTFISAFEAFSTDLLAELQAGDVSLHSFVSRARSAAIAFEGIVDAVGSQNPSALDLGSWMYNFREQCNPGEPLQSDLDIAISAYEDMFVDEGVGEGTSAGTGMHITWPNQGEFTGNRALWNQVLFNNPNYVTQITPRFKEFLQWYLDSSTPASSDTPSVCGEGAEVSPEAAQNAQPGALIISDSGRVNNNAGTFDVRATISASVSQMLVEYGIDLSTPLEPVMESMGYESSDDDYLYLLGGDVHGTYQGSTFRADWNQKFYFLNISGSSQFEALYVFDQGDGSRKVPCMYFPQARQQELSEMGFLDYLFFDFSAWISKGARFGFLSFSEDEANGRINDNLSLFISNAAGVFAELPRRAGGLMIPLVYIDGFIQGRRLNTLPGGFNQTVISWSENLDYNILTTPADRIFDVIPSVDAVVINMYAFNHGDPAADPDVRYYDVVRQRGQSGGLQLEPGDESDGDMSSGSTRLTIGLAALAGLCVMMCSALI